MTIILNLAQLLYVKENSISKSHHFYIPKLVDMIYGMYHNKWRKWCSFILGKNALKEIVWRIIRNVVHKK